MCLMICQLWKKGETAKGDKSRPEPIKRRSEDKGPRVLWRVRPDEPTTSAAVVVSFDPNSAGSPAACTDPESMLSRRS